MTKTLVLNQKQSLVLEPKPPYNFDANFHKPSHFPSTDNEWVKGKYWITMLWKNKVLGLKCNNIGTINKSR